jgi:ankyrin repeat protein
MSRHLPLNLFSSECAQQNHTQLMKCLLHAGATPEPFHPSMPFQCALHWAIRNKNIVMVKDLLDAGADFEAKDAQGCTALMLAASVFPAAALLLVQSGAVFLNIDAHHNNVLHFAAASDESAALIHEIAKHREGYLRMMPMRNLAGNTPLMVASLHQSVRTARAMLSEIYQLKTQVSQDRKNHLPPCELTTNDPNNHAKKRARIE